MAAKLSDEPCPCWGYFSASVEGKFCVWGGVTKDFPEENLTSSVQCFDPVLESWVHVGCSGPPPPGFYRGACTSSGRRLYLYGGVNGLRYQSSLHQLDTKSWTWKQLSTGPTRKGRCGMVAYSDKLVLFGGYGVPSGPTQQGAEFIEDSNYPSRGWTNEQHIFHLKDGEYECRQTSDSPL